MNSFYTYLLLSDIMPLQCVATYLEGYYSKKKDTSVNVNATKCKSDSTYGITIATVQKRKKCTEFDLKSEP